MKQVYPETPQAKMQCFRSYWTTKLTTMAIVRLP